MPKGWLYDEGEDGSERRAKPQRHVVDGLSCCEREIDEAKDRLGAHKGANDQLAPTTIR